MGDNKAAFSQGVFDSSHNITRFSFGAEYPGMVNPLAGVAKVELKAAVGLWSIIIFAIVVFVVVATVCSSSCFN